MGRSSKQSKDFFSIRELTVMGFFLTACIYIICCSHITTHATHIQFFPYTVWMYSLALLPSFLLNYLYIKRALIMKVSPTGSRCRTLPYTQNIVNNVFVKLERSRIYTFTFSFWRRPLCICVSWLCLVFSVLFRFNQTSHIFSYIIFLLLPRLPPSATVQRLKRSIQTGSDKSIVVVTTFSRRWGGFHLGQGVQHNSHHLSRCHRSAGLRHTRTTYPVAGKCRETLCIRRLIITKVCIEFIYSSNE